MKMLGISEGKNLSLALIMHFWKSVTVFDIIKVMIMAMRMQKTELCNKFTTSSKDGRLIAGELLLSACSIGSLLVYR